MDDVPARPPVKVHQASDVGERDWFRPLALERNPVAAGTRVSVHVNHVLPSELPFVATRMERHPATSQTFLPLDASRYLVVVAGRAPGGGPDPASIKAFWSSGSRGVTYRRDVWHHGMVVLDRPARFAVLMWRRSDGPDDVFADLPTPVSLRL